MLILIIVQMNNQANVQMDSQVNVQMNKKIDTDPRLWKPSHTHRPWKTSQSYPESLKWVTSLAYRPVGIYNVGPIRKNSISFAFVALEEDAEGTQTGFGAGKTAQYATQMATQAANVISIRATKNETISSKDSTHRAKLIIIALIAKTANFLGPIQISTWTS